MSDRFRAEIIIPKKFLTSDLELLIENDWLKLCYEDEFVKSYEDEQARNGELHIEDILIRDKIPFDRHSEGYYDIRPETRYYRPAEEGKEVINIVFEEDAGISYERLRDMLDDKDLDLRDYISKELHTSGYYIDIPDIESYK